MHECHTTAVTEFLILRKAPWFQLTVPTQLVW